MMDQVLYEDKVGQAKRFQGRRIQELPLSVFLKQAVVLHYGEQFSLSPPQEWAVDHGILKDSSHFLVSASTNSGKTLIALLRIFNRAIENRARFVYVVPLKALAEEKAAEFGHLANLILDNQGPFIPIMVSTGDYQLSGDFLDSAPPETGNLFICTPERLDVILRNPEYLPWVESVDTFVLDEFHLMGENHRGATMETLVTRLLQIASKSSILALSATIGEREKLEGWLAHAGHNVQGISSDYRYPLLQRRIVRTDNKDEFVGNLVSEIFLSHNKSLLVFVYRKTDAEKLTRELQVRFENPDKIEYFHSGLTLTKRREVLHAYHTGKIQVLITTTSLKMGINTPATHVLVRDTIFFGSGSLKTSDILQMLGRAGRGDQAGLGIVLCTSKEETEKYCADLKNGTIEPLEPQLIKSNHSNHSKRVKQKKSVPDPLKSFLLAEIARKKRAALSELQNFLQYSYSGYIEGLDSPDLSRQIHFLIKGKLIYIEENSENTYCITKLGRTTVFSGLSPESGAMLSKFLRGLIQLSQKQEEQGEFKQNFLWRLKSLDFLFISVAAFEVREQLTKKPKVKDLKKIQEYIEGLDSEEKPLVNLWRNVHSEQYPTHRLLSTLGYSGGLSIKELEIHYYQLMNTSILLLRHSKGEKIEALSEEFGIHPGSFENGLKYSTCWILNCLAQICSPKKCYKLDYLSMQIYELIEDLSLGSTLGKLLTLKGIGKKSVMKLIEFGYTELESLKELNALKLQESGLTVSQARKIMSYVKRRSR